MDANKIIVICLLCILAFESITARPHRRQRDIEIDTNGGIHTFDAAEESSEDIVGIERDGPVLSRRKRSTIAFMMDAYRRHCLHNPSACRDTTRRRGSRRRYSRRRHGYLIIDM